MGIEAFQQVGQYRFENRYGRTSHEYFPGLIAGDAGFGQEHGAVFGFHLGWSGNWRWIVDRSPHGDLLVQAGELFLPGELVLEPGEQYETPPLYIASANGLNDLSRERLRRSHLLRFADRLPVATVATRISTVRHGLPLLSSLVKLGCVGPSTSRALASRRVVMLCRSYLARFQTR